MFPYHESSHQTHNGLSQVQHDLQKVVHRHCAHDGTAVCHAAVGKGSSNGILRVHGACAVLAHFLAHEAVSEGVVVALEGDDQDRDDKPYRAEEEVQELEEMRREATVMIMIMAH